MVRAAHGVPRTRAGLARPIVRTVLAGLLAVTAAACTGSSGTSAAPDGGPSRASSGQAVRPTVLSPSTSADATATPTVTPVVNGRITSARPHLRANVGVYNWLAFHGASDTGLYVSYGPCHRCRPSTIRVARLTVVGPAGPVATITCSARPPCRARHSGNAATLGPGPDEITVESGDRLITVIGYDGTLRRTLDLTADLARGRDIRWLAWSPDGSRLAVLTGRGFDGSDIWLVEGDDVPQLAYSGSNPWMLRPVWSPDGQRLLVDQMIPRRHGHSFRSSGADVVVFHRSPAGSPPALTPQVLFHSNRGFDEAGNLAWSPDGTRIAVRTAGGIAEISTEDGRVLARHPGSRATSGWLIWLSAG